MIVTVFADKSGTRINAARDMDLTELERVIRETPPAADKDHLALLKLGTFGDKRSKKYALRHDPNVLTVTGIEGDYDGEQMPMQQAAQTLTARGLAALLYTSASHEPGAPRWRVVLPLSRTLEGTADELRESRRHWTGVLNAILGGVLKGESFVLSQCYYFGRIASRPDPEIIRLAGICIDELAQPPEPVFPAAAKEGKARGKKAARATNGEDRSADLLRRVGHDVRAGKTDSEIIAAWQNHPHAADQADPVRAVQRCIDRARADHAARPPRRAQHQAIESPPLEAYAAEWRQQVRPESLTLEQMLEHFVHIARGPLVVDLRNTYRRLRVGEFHAYYAHCLQWFDNKPVPISKLWAKSEERMTADCLTFHPGEPQFYTERDLRHFNIWERPDWPQGDIALAAPFLEHLEYLIPNDRARSDFIDWLAHAQQCPASRPHFHFLLVAQQQGTGRSWIAEVMRRLWGERHATEVDLHKLLDDSFNSILSAKIMVAVQEVRVPADERYQHKDRLKSLFTDSVITINEKHEPRWTERFVARFLMFTNRDDALPLAENDRRVYVVRCADEPRDERYYIRLYDRLNDTDFLTAVWQLLRERDLSGFNPGARAPLTEIKEQMIQTGRTDEQQDAIEFAQACPHEVIAADDLMQVLVPALEDEPARDRKARIAAVTAVLREVGIQTRKGKVWIDDQMTRVWILRNASKWTVATSALIREGAMRTRAELRQRSWILTTVMRVWRGDDD
jgi:hypothetical protein